MSDCGCILTGKAERAARKALEAKEARLRAADRRDGGHRLRDHNAEQARLFRDLKRHCREVHGRSWW